MKRYIRSESYRRQHTASLPDAISALRSDIKTIARCENQAELDTCEIKSYNSKYIKKVWEDLAEKQGITDFDEKIDMILEWLQNSMQYYKADMDKYSEEVKTADAVINKIMNYMKTVTDYCYSFNSVDSIFEIEPMDGSDLSRSSLQQFIDNLLEALGGRYYGTGRGGSWTSWNVLIDGIEFQIGPSDDRSCWIIREI